MGTEDSDLTIPRMSTEELRRFVLGYCDGLLFTSAQVTESWNLGNVFLPLALGGALGRARNLGDAGIVWEWMSESLPRTVNGYPMFLSVRVMHREDWARAHQAIEREFERRQSIDV